MKNGIVHSGTFNISSPKFKQEMDLFAQQVNSKMREYKIKAFVTLEKRTGDKLEIAVIPAAMTPGGKPETTGSDDKSKQLKDAGFTSSGEINTTSDFSIKSLKSFNFDEVITFGTPKKKAEPEK